MPDKNKTVKVLEEFVATKNANPSMSDADIVQKFPEVNAFAESRGVDQSTVLNELNNYHSNFTSGKFPSFNELNDASTFFFTPTPAPTQAPVPEGTAQPIVDQAAVDTGITPQAAPPIVSTQKTPIEAKVLEQFIATKNDNPDQADDFFMDKFPEIRAYSELKGISRENVMNQLNSYYGDFKSGKFSTLEDLNATYDFNIPESLKKKEETIQEVSTEQLPPVTGQQAPVSDSSLPSTDPLQQQSPSDGVISGSQPLGQGEFVAPTVSREQMMSEFAQRNDVEFVGERVSFEQDEKIRKGLIDEYNELIANDPDFLNRAQDFQEQQIAERKEKVSKNIIDAYIPKLSKTLNIPEEDLRENLPKWALQSELNDPAGNSLFLSNEGKFERENQSELGVFVPLTDVRSQLANQEVVRLGEGGKKEFFNEVLKESGGDEQKAQAAFQQDMDEVGFTFTSENDLKIRDLKQQIFELEKNPERTTKDDLSLKQKQAQLDEMVEAGLTGKGNLFDPSTGEFVSGNTKDPQVVAFNEEIAKNIAKYQNTDVGTLRKLRDDLYFQYQNYVNDVMVNQPTNLSSLSRNTLGLDQIDTSKDAESKDKIMDAAIRTYEGGFTGYKNLLVGGVGGEGDGSDAFKLVNSGFWSDKYTGKANDILANYIAVNRMLVLNEDPGTVQEDEGFAGFTEAVGQGLKQAVGGTSTTQSAIADRAINQLEGLGFGITDIQKDKLHKTLGQQVGTAVGASIPISLEIGLNIAIGNKLAGVAKIPELAQAMAGGNKIKQFGLTVLYESALQGAAFAASGESFASGVGEGVGQAVGSALLSRFGVKNKLLNFGTRAITGATTETMAEFSGQFLEELTENGFDIQKATEDTFGKTAEEGIEKLAITYFTALTMGMGGASQQSQLFLTQAQQEIQASDSDSPIVKAAKEVDITSEVTNEETIELEELEKKIEAGEDLTDEETLRAEFIQQKQEFNESKAAEQPVAELSPTVLINTEKETEYRFKEGGKEGFVSEKELVERLEDESFVEKVKSGEIELDITNPSPEAEAKINEKFPENPEVEAQKQEFEQAESALEAEPTEGVETTGEPDVTDVTDVAGEVISDTAPKVTEKTATTAKPAGKVSEEVETEAEPITEETVAPVSTPSFQEASNTLSETIESVEEGVDPFTNDQVIESLVSTGVSIGIETGLKGVELSNEIKSRLSEKLGETFSEGIVDNNIDQITTGIESAIEAQKAPVIPEQKISKVTDKIADKILGLKIDIDLTKFSTSPVPIAQAAINTALTAAAATVRLSGNIAQGVADGINALKQTEWYKSLSAESKQGIEDALQAQLTTKMAEIEKVELAAEPKPKKKPKVRKPKKVKKEVAPGETKLDPANKRFAERIDKQSNLSRETKTRIVEKSKNIVSNQKTLLKDSKASFDEIMTETDGNYKEVIRLADSPQVSPDFTEMLYAHVMQHLSVLEKSSDPAVSIAASNDLVDLGIQTAERLNKSGKQIASMATIYKNFPMYTLYSSMARIEKFAQKKNKKKTAPGKVKLEATDEVSDIIADVEENLDEYLNDPKIKKKLESIKKKLERRSKRPAGLTAERKAAIQKRKKEIRNKFFGRTGKLQAGIPLGDQLIAILEFAGLLIEEGFYRSQDIIAELKEASGTKISDAQLKESLKSLKQFRDILEREKKEGTGRDSFGSTIQQAVSEYLNAGLESLEMTMDQALVSSDATKKGIKDNLIKQLQSDLDISKSEAQSVVDVVDQIFRDRSLVKLRKSLDSQFPKMSIKKQKLKSKAEKLADDVALGAFDMSLSVAALTFQKHGMVNTTDPEIISKLKTLADKMRNAPDGVLKDLHRKNLETFIHQQTEGYGFKDWAFTRFYGSILSGIVTHAKNMKYNTFAVGIIGPLTQVYTAGANPIRTFKEMVKSFYQVDRKVASHYVKTGDNFIDPGFGPKSFADQLEFNLLRNGFTKFLNIASTRLLVSSDLILTRPYANAVFKNNVKAWLKGEEKISGNKLEKRASELMGYTPENVDKSSKQAMEDIITDYGFDPFADGVAQSIKKEAAVLLLLRTQERIFENSGIQELMGEENWLDVWNGESLAESATSEARNLALQGEVTGFIGIITEALQDLIDAIPLLKFKIPFVNILGNMFNMSLKWLPGIGQVRTLTRYAINKKLSDKGMNTVSSSTGWIIDEMGKKLGFPLIKEGVLDRYQKPVSKRNTERDFKHMLFITGTQALIYAMLAKDEDDEGLVITGALDKSFFERESIEKGTGTKRFGVFWRGGDGKETLITEYKNSAYGFALAYYGALNDEFAKAGGVDAKDFINAWFSSAFFIADKPAAIALKEVFDLVSPTDKYGNNKWLDDTGYKDASSIAWSKFLNSALVPNLFKQGVKIGEEVYGVDKQRQTDWWSTLTKGLPFTGSEGLETQVDHFGQTVQSKFDLGFLGVEGSTEEGFIMLEPTKVDPYYEAYTNHGETPNWYTKKEIPVYRKDEFGFWGKVKVDKSDGTTENGNIRLSKNESHIINMLIGQFRKEAIDNLVEFDFEKKELVTGVEALSGSTRNEFDRMNRKIEKEAKEKAFIEFFENIYQEEIVFSNKDKEKKFQKFE